MTMIQFHAAATQPGSSQKPNEDRYVVNPSLMAVIDGATGKTIGGRRFLPNAVEGSDSAWLAARAVDYLSLFHRSSAQETLIDLNYSLRDQFREAATFYPDQQPFEFPCASIALAQISNNMLDLARLGDVATIVEMKDGDILELKGDPRHRESDLDVISQVTAYRAQTGATIDEARAHFFDLMSDKIMRANRKGAHGHLNTRDARPHDDCFGTLSVPVKDVKRVIMMTDGFSAAVEEYKLYSVQTLLDASSNEDYDVMIQIIRDVERSDRDCKDFPRLKISDDSTVVSAHLMPSRMAKPFGL